MQFVSYFKNKARDLGIPVACIFRYANLHISNVERWESGKSSPTMASYDKIMNAIEALEKEKEANLQRELYLEEEKIVTISRLINELKVLEREYKSRNKSQ